MKTIFVRSLWALFFSILIGAGMATGAMGFIGAMKLLAEVLR